MAAFSSSYQLPSTFLLDSIFLPNTNTNHLHPAEHNPNPITSYNFQESSCLDDDDDDYDHEHSTEINGNSLTAKHSTDSSTLSMVDYSTGEQVSQQQRTSIHKKRKTNNNSKDSAQPKGIIREGRMCKKQKKCNGDGMKKYEKKEGKGDGRKEEREVADELPKGYIHVRARRGQATDSHSLAERVRREKISERMKILQKLVPGCDKVTGKAFMLDEIINYVQSLQNQVEFLSLKLAALSPMLYDFGLDAFTITPEGLNGLAFPAQESNTNQSTAFTDAAPGFTQITPHHLLDASVLLHPGRSPIAFPQNNDSHQLWDVDNHRQNLFNSAGSSYSLCSLH